MLWLSLVTAGLAGVPSAQVIFMVDASHSWSETEYALAREGLRDGLDALAVRTDLDIEVGLVVFANRYAWVYSELQPLSTNLGDLQDQWSGLARLSNAGFDMDPDDGVDCRRHYVFDPANANNFDAPPGGCYPTMPRKYWDETGTDHTNSLRLAYQMFEAAPDADLRVTLMLTDGLPTPIPVDNGTARDVDEAAGYVSPWYMLEGQAGRDPAVIRRNATQLSHRLWRDFRAHQWVFAYRETDPWMGTMVQGQGALFMTPDAREIGPELVSIVTP